MLCRTNVHVLTLDTVITFTLESLYLWRTNIYFQWWQICTFEWCGVYGMFTKFEDTKWVIRIRTSKKHRQCNDKTKDKRTNNDLQKNRYYYYYSYIFIKHQTVKTESLYIKSDLPKWSPLLSSHLYSKVTFFLSCHRKTSYELDLFKEVTCLIRPLFVCA
jgi:hypothetical protein